MKYYLKIFLNIILFKFRKLKWVWDSQFRCPSLTGITRRANGYKSRDGAVEHAVLNFMDESKCHNKLTPAMLDQLYNSIK
jgi:hypothetical protein